MSTALAVQDEQAEWLPEQKAALEAMGVKNASGAELKVFLAYCQRSGLDPFTRQIYLVPRGGKQTVQVAIDGFRLIARRAADRAGVTISYDDTVWCGEDGVWTDVWTKPGKPTAAKVVVFRGGDRFSAVARTASYEDTRSQTWQNQPDNMIAKCAEALALRKAFPQDLSGLYTSDEMAQADRETTTRVEQIRPAAAKAQTIREKAAAPAAPPQPLSDDATEMLDMIAGTDDLDTLRGWYPEWKEPEVRKAIMARVEFIKRMQLGEPVDAETLDEMPG